MARRERGRGPLGRGYVRGMAGLAIGLSTLAGTVYYGVPFINAHWTASWVTMATVAVLAVGTANLAETERRRRARLIREAERRARGEGYAAEAPTSFDAQVEALLREQEREAIRSASTGPLLDELIEAHQAANQQFGARLDELAAQLGRIVTVIDGEPTAHGRRAGPR